MENLALVSSSKVVVLSSFTTPQRDVISKKSLFSVFTTTRRAIGPIKKATSSTSVFCHSQGSAPLKIPKFNAREKQMSEYFASITSSGSQETTSVGVKPQLSMPPPSSNVGSPLFWIGVGVGLSALFSWVATYLKNYAMQQAFKSVMGNMEAQNNQFKNAPFSPGSPFFPTPPSGFQTPPSRPATSPSPVASSEATVDVPVTKVESPTTAEVKDDGELKTKPKKSDFVDVSPEETLQNNPFESFKESSGKETSKDSQFNNQHFQNGAAYKTGFDASQGFSSSRTEEPLLTVEALEKMMEDPKMQQMIYPYLPEEMRNPTTFKMMIQDPQNRQQLQNMLNSMGGTTEWDKRVKETIQNFDIDSPEVKQQFDQLGLSPQEVLSKIMANPDVAQAFQNPRVQAAILDCSQDPMSIAKYQNDKEVMDVFNKISELFPGVTGP